MHFSSVPLLSLPHPTPTRHTETEEDTEIQAQTMAQSQTQTRHGHNTNTSTDTYTVRRTGVDTQVNTHTHAKTHEYICAHTLQRSQANGKTKSDANLQLLYDCTLPLHLNRPGRHLRHSNVESSVLVFKLFLCKANRQSQAHALREVDML